MTYEVLQKFNKTGDYRIAFVGTFDECVTFCESVYNKDSVNSFPEELIWGDLNSTCEIFKNLDNANLN